ncbi:MAG: tetratricopeptide repeat protein [Oscillospiraceae bacterium]|jgi:tetratricopeptide (TPR) repeat protein|nr:tetratricopeptide repeat protein [Oscillospiraceae bacterium]
MKKLISGLLPLVLLLSFASCAKAYTPKPNPPLVLGEKYLTDLDYEQALLQFDEAIKIDPKNPRGYLGKYAVLEFLDRHAEAERVLREGKKKAADIEMKAVLDAARVSAEDGLASAVEVYKEMGFKDFALKLLKVCIEVYHSAERFVDALAVLTEELGVEPSVSAAAAAVTTAAVTDKRTEASTTTAATTKTTAPATTKTTTTEKSGIRLEDFSIWDMLADELRSLLSSHATIHTREQVWTYFTWNDSTVSLYGVYPGMDATQARSLLAQQGRKIEDGKTRLGHEKMTYCFTVSNRTDYSADGWATIDVGWNEEAGQVSAMTCEQEFTAW